MGATVAMGVVAVMARETRTSAVSERFQCILLVGLLSGGGGCRATQRCDGAESIAFPIMLGTLCDSIICLFQELAVCHDSEARVNVILLPSLESRTLNRAIVITAKTPTTGTRNPGNVQTRK